MLQISVQPFFVTFEGHTLMSRKISNKHLRVAHRTLAVPVSESFCVFLLSGLLASTVAGVAAVAREAVVAGEAAVAEHTVTVKFK